MQKDQDDIQAMVEDRCRSMTFERATRDLSTDVRESLRNSLSRIIQARIEYDHINASVDMRKLSPNQLRLLSDFKRNLISEISKPELDTLPVLEP